MIIATLLLLGLGCGLLLARLGLAWPTDLLMIVLCTLPPLVLEVCLIHALQRRFGWRWLNQLKLDHTTFGYFSLGLGIAMIILRP